MPVRLFLTVDMVVCVFAVMDAVQEMLELIEFIDEEFSRRDAVLCFIWSRLRTSMDIDPAR